MRENKNRFELYIRNHNGINFSGSSNELHLLMPFDILGIDDYIILDLENNEVYIDGVKATNQIEHLFSLCEKAKDKYFSTK